MKKFLGAATAASALLPAIASADLTSTTGSIKSSIGTLTDVVNAVIPFFLAIAVVVFIYGVIKYVISPSADDRAAARGYIIYGIIGIAVILTVLGLAKLLVGTLGITPGAGGVTGGDLPKVPTSNN